MVKPKEFIHTALKVSLEDLNWWKIYLQEEARDNEKEKEKESGMNWPRIVRKLLIFSDIVQLLYHAFHLILERCNPCITWHNIHQFILFLKKMSRMLFLLNVRIQIATKVAWKTAIM